MSQSTHLKGEVEKDAPPTLSLTQKIIFTAIFLIGITSIIGKLIEIRNGVVSLNQDREMIVAELNDQGYRLLVDYRRPNDGVHTIKQKIYPDTINCDTPSSLVFIARSGKEVDFINSEMGFCK